MQEKYILLSHVKDHVGEQVNLKGWVYNKRSSGKISFIQFRDGTGYIQVTVLKNLVDEPSYQAVSEATLESSIEVWGELKEDSRSPYGYELLASKVKLIQKAPDDYPIGKKEHGTDFLLNNRHFWLRTPKQQAIQKVRDTIISSIYEYYHQQDFIKLDTPIFTPNACEGTTTLFEVDYFDQKAYLSQSGQLYLEAVLPAFNRVFDFSPVFRAEKSKTRRHLTEFWMTNAEAAFVDHQENLKIQEGLVFHIIQSVLKSNLKELEILERNIEFLKNIKLPFPRIKHSEAVKMLKSLGSQIGERDDLGAEDETLLTQEFSAPVFVENYPAEVKAFYMKRNLVDPSRAECADLLAPEGYGEMIGGSERETDYEILLKSIHEHKLPVDQFSWYLDIRKYGSITHSGFGLGLERTVAWICGLHHVRETIPFPRTIYRLSP